jgi:phosphatidate cytidylyltransferase
LLRQRTLSALVFGPLVVGACFLGGPAYTGFILVTGALCAWEYSRMMSGAGIDLTAAFIPLCVAIALSGLSNRPDWLLASIIGGSLVLLAASVRQGMQASAFALSGAIYIGALLGALGLLRVQADGREWCFFALFITWANDMGAYFGGRAFGRHKLAPAISPGKSWEGAAFGLGTGTAIGAALGSWVGFSVPEGAAAGALLAAMAQIGDLVESGFKRYCKVKDSGKALPGHGGFLDRFDSLLFTGAGGLLIRGIHRLLFHP